MRVLVVINANNINPLTFFLSDIALNIGLHSIYSLVSQLLQEGREYLSNVEIIIGKQQYRRTENSSSHLGEMARLST